MTTVLSDGRAPTYDDLAPASLHPPGGRGVAALYPPGVADHPPGARRRRDRRAPRSGAGGLVILSPWVTQHDARWWADPERFDPDRWSAERRGDAPRFAYFPFGAGPRLCIGRDFALVESVLLLASLAARYELAPVPGHEVHAEPLVTIRPKGGLPMLVTRPLTRPTRPHPLRRAAERRTLEAAEPGPRRTADRLGPPRRPP